MKVLGRVKSMAYFYVIKHYNMNALQIYFRWSFTALLGNDPQTSDAYLCQNMATIKFAARSLLLAIEYRPAPVYRGIVMREPITELKPHPNFTYLSFSEDRAIADHFGDPTAEGFGSLGYLGEHGYTIAYTPQFDEVLFHYKFFEILPYVEVMAKIGVDGTLAPAQKEVTILQPATPFTSLTPFKR